MIFSWALAAAIGCAFCNGFAAILQKIGADGETTVDSAHPNLLWRLRGSGAFMLGIALDLIASVFTLVAVHRLPLFIVQPMIAGGVMITALVDHFVLRHNVSVATRIAVPILLSGLVLLGLVATPEPAEPVGHVVQLVLGLVPVGLLVIGIVLAKLKTTTAMAGLAFVSGLAFGGGAIMGRMLIFPHPIYRLIGQPLVWSLVAYGLIGLLFFTIALQRAQATIVNAIMIAAETSFPITIGFVFFNDRPRDNLWALAVIGIALAFGGALLVAATHVDQPLNKKVPKPEPKPA
jgi:drug/metabolite transporter (DMT)-like permease